MPQAQAHCAACGATFEPEAYETFQHVEYLLWWLDVQGDALPDADFGRLRERAEQQLAVLRRRLGLGAPEAEPPVAAVVQPVAPPAIPAAAPGAPPEALPTAPVAAAEPAAEPAVAPVIQAKAAEVAPAQPEAVQPAPVAPESFADWERRKKAEKAPAPKPKPSEPVVDWGKLRGQIGAAAASGALLRALLYLGAFMIVVSLAILVARFWDRFPSWAQAGFIFSVPAVFYAAGFLLYLRAGLKQAGSVLVGIGALLVAVDFAAIYQFGDLAGVIDAKTFWLATSAFCTLLWALTAWRLPVPFVGYTVGLGAANLFAAVPAILHLTFPWWATAGGLSAYPIGLLAARLRRGAERWAGLAQAGLIWSAAVLAAAQVASLAVPGRAPWAPVAAFALAAGGYAWLAGRLNAAFLLHAASWSAAATVFLGLRALDVRWEWYAAAAAILALVYLLAARWQGRRAARMPDAAMQRYAGLALRITAASLLIGAIVAGLASLWIEEWAGIAALALAAATLAAWSILERRPWLLAAACGLFVVPVLEAAWVLMRSAGVAPQAMLIRWLVAAAAGLALLYLLIAAAVRRWEMYAGKLHLAAHVLAPVAGFSLAAAAANDATYQWLRVGSNLGDTRPLLAPSTVALGMILLVYIVSALLHHTKAHPGLSRPVTRLRGSLAENRFLWPAAALLPFWVCAGVAWLAPGLPAAWLGVIVGAFGLAYVWLGQLLARSAPAYRTPPQALAYALAAVGIATALRETWASFAALLLAVAALASLSLVKRRYVEAIAASLLFIWPFQIALDEAGLPRQVQALAYALLGSLGYMSLGLAWLHRDRGRAGHIRPDIPIMAAMSYIMTIGAVAASLFGRYLLAWPDLPWIRVLTALVAAGLGTFSVFRFRRGAAAWAAVPLLGLAFGELLEAARVPVAYLPVAWTGLAPAAVGLGYGLKAVRLPGWLRAFGTPMNAGAALAGVIGLALTVPGTADAFAGRPVTGYFPLILAQGCALLAVIAAALLHRWSLLLYLEPVLAFFPVTLFFIGYGERLFGRPLVSAEHALVWTGLALIHLVIAALVDRRPIRYSRGLYAGGYLLLLFAVLWSTADRSVNLIVSGVAILVCLASQILEHRGLHRSFRELVTMIWRKPESPGYRGMCMIFLFVAAYSIPAWLNQFLRATAIALEWRGLALAALAAIYIALDLLLGRLRRDYRLPFFTAGYILTIVAIPMPWGDQPLTIAVLGIDAAIYAASALILRQPFWFYLTNALVPVIALQTLEVSHLWGAAWSASTLMILAAAELAIGISIQRRQNVKERIKPFSLPFLIAGFLFAALALTAASGRREVAIPIFTAAAAACALSAWLLCRPLFIYPAALVAIVPYYLGMTWTALPRAWYGLGLLPLALAMIVLSRLAFDRGRPPVIGARERFAALARPEAPLYLVGYGITVGMIGRAAPYPLPLTVVLAVLAAIYVGSAVLFRQRLWLYPGLLVAHVALGEGLVRLGTWRTMTELAGIALPFHALTWAMIACVLGFSWTRLRDDTRPGNKAAALLIRPSWAQPFALFAAADIVIWQSLALYNWPVAIWLAAGHVAMLAALAVLWHDRLLPYAAAFFLLLGVGCGLAQGGVAWPALAAWMAVAGLILYLIGAALDWLAGRGRCGQRLAIWPPALARVGTVAATLGLLVAILGGITGRPLVAAGALAATGALYLAIAYRRRHFELGYLAISMLLAAWLLTLAVQGVRQPQGYAIAAGVYVATIGVLERRRDRQRFACTLESLGVTAPMLTTFLQSLLLDSGRLYFIVLLLESALVIWWSASRRVKAPFFVGIGFSIVNIIAQLVMLATVNDVLRWVIILGAGLLMVGSAILVERRRSAVASRLRDWQAGMNEWRM